MNSDDDTAGSLRRWVAPFGDPGINDRSHLPRAFRSVPRPSSPLSAKASTRCPSFARDPPSARSKALAEHRRAQRPAPDPTPPGTLQRRTTPAQPDPKPARTRPRMKTLLSDRPSPPRDRSAPAPPGLLPDRPNPIAPRRGRGGPPRSHSQIRFTLQSTPRPAPPDPRGPRRTNPPQTRLFSKRRRHQGSGAELREQIPAAGEWTGEWR